MINLFGARGQNTPTTNVVPPPARSPPENGHWSLDTPLLHLSPQDAWTVRNACEGTQIWGSIGAGKTSGSGAALARAMLRSDFGMLVLCAKPDERATWERYAAETGRQDDLIVVSPGHPYPDGVEWQFNFLDYEVHRHGDGAGQTENLVHLLTTVADIAGGRQAAVNAEPFWDRAMQELLRNTVDVLLLVRERLTMDDISRFIAEAPVSLAQVAGKAEDGKEGDTTWGDTSFCARCVEEAWQQAGSLSEQQRHDLEVCTRYWTQSYPGLSDRTRSSIVANYTSVVDKLMHGWAYRLLCRDTTFTPDMTWTEGKIIVLDLSIQEYRAVGALVQGIIKYAWQQAVLRRDVVRFPRPVALWADEAQNFISAFDFEYQAVARSARACTVFLSQNISNYEAVLGNRAQVLSLLGNFVTQIMHASSSSETNTYFSELIGQHWTETHSGGHHVGSGDMNINTGWSEGVHYKVLPETFTRLKKGGPFNDWIVEGYVYQGGRVWEASGDTYLPVHFQQR